jgi:DNA-binding CsgD family transcriptional regulator
MACDGSSYHRRMRLGVDVTDACVLAATEVYVGLTSDRADRRAFPPEDAAAELRLLESRGVLDSRASRAVLVAAGHGEPRARTGRRLRNPGGLSRREIDVLRLAARGLTTRQIADQLFISPKTTDHHIQHIYNKIGASTRAAAALWGHAERRRRVSGGPIFGNPSAAIPAHYPMADLAGTRQANLPALATRWRT